jgi:hypothetical protein
LLVRFGHIDEKLKGIAIRENGFNPYFTFADGYIPADYLIGSNRLAFYQADLHDIKILSDIFIHAINLDGSWKDGL